MKPKRTRPEDQPAVRQRMILAVVLLLIVLCWGVAHVMNLGISWLVLLEGVAAWLAIFFFLRFFFTYRTVAKRKKRIKARRKARLEQAQDGSE